MEKDKKVLIVDGHHLLFRMFFGIPKKVLNKDGKIVNGVLGFSGALFRLVNQIKPDFALVVFDSEQELLRKKLDENYKSNRVDYSDVPELENPFSQMNFLEQFLNSVNIKFIYANNGIEADDVIATIALNNPQHKHYIVSGDNDFHQLVSQNIFVVNYKNPVSVIYNTSLVVEKYGVEPNKLPLYKALVGDSADNITGVSKIGKITAQKIINTHNTLENIYNNLHTFSQTIKNNLIAEKDILLTNIELVKLDIIPNLKINLNDFEINFDFENTTSKQQLRKLGIF